MTPAVAQARKAKIKFTLHEYDHDPKILAYGREAAEKLGIAQDLLFKTLVVAVGSRDLAVAVVPVAGHLNLKVFVKALGGKKAGMADKQMAEKVTGYLTGGVSPMGQKKRLQVLIDASARDLDKIWVSAGRRGLQMGLSPHDLARLTRAVFHAIARSD